MQTHTRTDCGTQGLGAAHQHGGHTRGCARRNARQGRDLWPRAACKDVELTLMTLWTCNGLPTGLRSLYHSRKIQFHEIIS